MGTQCKVIMHDGKECGRDLHCYRKCILHRSHKNIITGNSFEIELQEYLSREPEVFDFTSFIFPENGWELPKKFEKEVYFNKAVFKGDVNFRDKVFLNNVYFHKTTFQGEAHFKSFKKEVIFSEVVFERVARFTEAEFSEETTFVYTTFKEKSFFTNCHILKSIEFDNCLFEKYTDFMSFEVSKNCEANFVFNQFRGITQFNIAKFKGKCSFLKSTFHKIVDFDNAHFYSYVEFNNTSFSNHSSFRGCIFDYKVDFNYALFNKPTSFNKAKFRHEVEFGRTNFQSSVDFTDAKFSDEKENNFKGCNFEIPSKTQFMNNNLSNCLFMYCDVSEVVFNNVVWAEKKIIKSFFTLFFSPRKVVRDELILRKKIKNSNYKVEENEYEGVKQIYRRLQKNYNESYKYVEAGDFFIGEREMLRLAAPRRSLFRFTSFLYKWISFYGENFKLPLYWLILILFLTPVTLLFTGITLDYNPELGRPETPINYNFAFDIPQIGSTILHYLKACVENISLLMSFGRGSMRDYLPTYWSQVIVVVETITIVSLVTFFLLALRRKFKRKSF